jgi:predicted acyl esterase
MRLSSRSAFAALALLLMLAAPLAGCFADEAVTAVEEDDSRWLPSVYERANMDYRDDDIYSRVSVNGTFEIDSVRSIFVDVPDINLADGGAGVTGGAVVHLGLWLPIIEGCDWETAELPAKCQIPVISEIGPYYDDGDTSATTPADRLGKFLIENFVPHGFAIAQVSVFGTGESNHCMDLMGLDEQTGIDAAVEWLGTQSWSNGNVGIIGKSYDGSTPWNAAATGSEYIKTIVPMSGLIGLHELMWRNGSMEFRGAVMHNGVYGAFGIDGDTGDIENACEGYIEGYYAGIAAYISGDNLAWTGSDYWEERYFLDRVIDNYNGSVYIIHGMQDWNVDPHMAFPTHNLLIGNGFEVKGMYGQWGHDYPDRADGHSGLSPGRGAEAFPFTLRWDWADDLLEWFDFYLKEEGVKPLLHAEIQDNIGGWRVEQQYPPSDVIVQEYPFDSNGCELISGGSSISTTSQTVLECTAFTDDTRIVGTPTVSIESTIFPTATSGHLFVEMVQASNGMHLGHAVMDLRFHAGGKNGQVLLPGQTVTANMEFLGMDVVVPAGDGIRLIISQTGEDYVPSPISVQPVSIAIDASSSLSLTIVERNCSDLFLPPMQEPYPFC